MSSSLSNSLLVQAKGGWQRPARTEEWVYDQLRKANVQSIFFQFLSFPWATLIDCKRRGKSDRVRKLEASAFKFGPRKTLIRATVCQHIWALDLLPMFQRLGVTDLFWPHAVEGQNIIDDIRIHPFPLFPVRAYEGLNYDEKPTNENHRNYLCNFVGAYDPDGYLTPVRKWIFELPDSEDLVIKRRERWHYEAEVYHRQIDGASLDVNSKANADSNALEYDQLLRSSIFTLCPSGSGPNSIRLWEAIAFGSIPVLLSDTLRLPGRIEEWDDVIVRVPETRAAVRSLPETLNRLAEDQALLSQYRRGMKGAAMRYIMNAAITLIKPLSQESKINEIIYGR